MVSVKGVLNGVKETRSHEPVAWAAATYLRYNVSRLTDTLLSALSDRIIDEGELLRDVADVVDYYGEPEEVSVELDFPGATSKIAWREGVFRFERPNVCVVRDVTIAGANRIPITESGRILGPAVGKPNVVGLTLADALPKLQPISDVFFESVYGDVIETGVLLHNYWSDGYFHWVMDDLTRLVGLERSELVDENDVTFILAPDAPEWQREYLELLGYSSRNIVSNADTPLLIENLVVPSLRRREVVSPTACDWLRDKLLEKTDETESDLRRVYVSRSDADRRRILNEGELLDRLESLGFEKYVLTELTVEQQVALFASAEVVVGPHGANLTNILYGDDVTVYELYSDHVTPEFAVLSDMFDFGHRYFRCEPYSPHIKVDSDELRRVLSTQIGERPANSL